MFRDIIITVRVGQKPDYFEVFTSCTADEGESKKVATA